ncbi:MAG: MFS transporter, partial [Acetobacteraceae bacterium]
VALTVRGGSLSFYAFTTFMQKYLVNTAGLPTRTVSATMAFVLFGFMLLQPVFGAISDRIGRRGMLIAFGALGALMTVPLLTALAGVQSPVMAGLLVLAGLAVISCYTSISGLVKAELFPGEVRALGVGLPYAVANALFGGTAEYVGLWFKSVGAESGFFWYVTGFFVIALVTAWLMPETRVESHLSREHGGAPARG